MHNKCHEWKKIRILLNLKKNGFDVDLMPWKRYSINPKFLESVVFFESWISI